MEDNEYPVIIKKSDEILKHESEEDNSQEVKEIEDKVLNDELEETTHKEIEETKTLDKEEKFGIENPMDILDKLILVYKKNK
ncbi:hypothetical protein K8M07_03170 [Schnuerera sp. xch1]|uniref:hypothetical protein n=1 Tax=Schnuerera sp. xch1 TaxID=2874283 RepID=UPI001CC1B872|nr:hypothetical protein [Schnuerera sp. xch1]MBZ2174242.1 hypothetical protein [Schnuerera sp. xch1]